MLIAIKRNKLLIQATMLINPKSIMLNERSQTRKALYSIILFVLHSRKGQTIVTEIRCVYQDWGGRGRDKVNRGVRELWGRNQRVSKVLVYILILMLSAVYTEFILFFKTVHMHYIFPGVIYFTTTIK